MGELRGPVLIVDDDPAIGKVLSALLGQIDVQCILADSGESALELLERRPIELIISDLRMPGIDGLSLLRRVTAEWPDLPVILLTAHGSVPVAVEAMKAGAADFLLKPFERDEVIFVVEKALATASKARVAGPPVALSGLPLLGESRAIAAVRDHVRRAASCLSTVLIQGEAGTGKELVARAIHESSARRDAPFVRLSVVGVAEQLLESECFGHEKGAFVGACSSKPGRIELAQGGTLFLDEVSELPLAMQVKLMRVLQDRELERLGDTRTIQVDVRFIASTHVGLQAQVERGEFREDLYYSLNVVPIKLAPLRERSEDIALLVRRYAAAVAKNTGRPSVSFEREALELLEVQPFPGNVRQLENLVERLIVFSGTGRISAAEVEAELSRDVELQRAAPRSANRAPALLDNERRSAEKTAVERALVSAGNNRSLAARLLGVSRRTLYNKLEEFGLA
jgi:two-component system response regulator AtoC